MIKSNSGEFPHLCKFWIITVQKDDYFLSSSEVDLQRYLYIELDFFFNKFCIFYCRGRQNTACGTLKNVEN